MTPARRQRLLLIATVSVLGLLLLDRVAFTPLLAHWRSAALETATLRRNLAAGAVAVQNAAHARQRWQEVQAAALPAEGLQGITASGPPLPVLLRALEVLRDLRMAAPRGDIASRHRDLERLRALAGGAA